MTNISRFAVPTYGLAAAVILAGFAVPLLVRSQLMLSLLGQCVTMAIIASSLGFFIRQTGRVSFGHAVYAGLGGYCVALASTRLGWPNELAFLLALVLPTVVAFLFGLLVLRIAGIAFSMITLAFGQALTEVFVRWRELANGEDGLVFNLAGSLFGVPVAWLQTASGYFISGWIVLVVSLVAFHVLANSHVGLVTSAIRENEERVRFLGFGVTLWRASILAIAAFVAALGGALSAIYNAYVSPDLIHWSTSAMIMIMAIIGGTKGTVGPAIGAAVYFVLKELAGDYSDHWPAFVGLLLIVITIAMPGGIWGELATRTRKLFGGGRA